MNISIWQVERRWERVSEFKCVVCEGVFEKELTDKEAEEQLKEEFPGWTTEQCDLICDDCFKKMWG